ncbi:thiamine phosphate synthase [Campylobacter showae]|uniref:thiamine phosphate synthase n=1 Tax=Campylobacter showae TaxID=204 RepID=UPI0028D4292D|nr:thiamine phosphate synthase [Campylobacter showae]
MAKIYAITDDVLTPESSVLAQVGELLECGVKLLQYRTKLEPKNERVAVALKELCERYGARFIVNDDVKFAAKIGANAVHIGKDDGGVKAARKILGEDAFIGVSCYDDLNLALKAQDEGASYAAFGAVFASPTKPNAPLCKFETIVRAKEILHIPVCVIGGINAANIAQIAALNPDYVAVISALYRPASIKENLRNLQAFL